MTGHIPNLDALSNLKNLELGSNQLNGAFPDLGALSNLSALSLVSNQLSGPIPDLSKLTNLTALYLTSNQLSRAHSRSEQTHQPDAPLPRLQPVERANPSS